MELSVEHYLTHNYPAFVSYPQKIRQALLFLFRKLAHEKEINAFIASHPHEDAFGFIESVLEYFNIDISINQNELSRIPSYGKVVIIANHPLGALDALALVHILKAVRKDIKIVASNFLGALDPIKEVLIPIENVKGTMSKTSIEAIYTALKKEHAVIIFPSGEVSRVRPQGIKDTQWRTGFLKIAQKSAAPVLPIFINAKNSRNFYLLSMINKSLATAFIPHEMFKYQGKSIGFRIGKLIPFEHYNLPSLSIEDRVKLFRKHLHYLGKKGREVFKTHNAIALAENRQELKHALRGAQLLGQTSDGKMIYLYSNPEHNVLIKEIGRLREISFRQVKEGSGKKRDLDDFDYYYEHIILWDDKELEIVGSYRVASAHEVVDALDVEGLYTATLFNYKKAFSPYIAQGLELGRSFIQPKYWNSRALDYLWQGIGAYLKAHPSIRYLFGPVSISRALDNDAVSLMVYFYRHYFAPKEPCVVHKDPYVLSHQQRTVCEELFTLDDHEEDLSRLKQALQQRGLAIPTLYRQYTDLCEEGGVQFMDFGLDKDFDNCVDGFIVVDINKFKPSKRSRYIKA